MLTIAAFLFPSPYDWRHRVISSLASPKDNPHFYGVATTGLALTGLLLWPFANALRDTIGTLSPRAGIGSFWLHRLGTICLVMTALISGKDRWLGLHRLHEDLAQLAGLFLGLAFLGWAYGLAMRYQHRLFASLALVALTLLPMGGILLSRLALLICHAESAPRDYELFKHSIYCSLAVAEWLSAGCLYFFLVLAACLGATNTVAK